MGGMGSGRHGGWRPTIENTNRLEINWLKKQGYLGLKHRGSLKWSMNGRDSGRVGYQMYSDKMVLNYRSRDRGEGEWKEVSQTIIFDETPCNYGGTRKWFLCPNCWSRVGVLVGLGTYFYCRKCYRIPYRSTLETDSDRIIAKKHKLGEQIFENYEHGDGWIKKKGMHQKTFQKKLAEYRRLEMQYSIRMHRFFDALSKLTP